MTPSRAMIAGLLMGFVACAGLLAVVFLGLSRASAAPSMQTSPPGAENTTRPNAAQPVPNADAQHYADLLTQNFAGQLGVDQAKVNAAFTAAVNAIVDQAVQDGKLTAEQAAKAKNAGNGGLGAFLGQALGGLGQADKSRGVEKVVDGPLAGVPDAVISAVGQLFGMTADQLRDAFKNGQTLTALEQAHNVTAQQVHDAALAAARAVINAGVQSGKWTQDQANQAYQDVSQNIDNLLLKLSNMGRAPQEQGADPQIDTIFQAMQDAIAPLFGLTTNQFLDALKSGQSLIALEQAHNVTHTAVQAAAHAAAQAALASGVPSGKWTQAQADKLAPELNALVDKLLTKMGGPPPAGAAGNTK